MGSDFKPRYEFVPSRNSMCLCGSGLRFKRCCATRLPSVTLGRASRRAFRDGKPDEALLAARADITQYTIWHKSHTEPVIKLGIKEIEPLLKVDLQALGELVDTLLTCHFLSNQTKEFSAVLERLRSNIKDERWQRKVTFFHALNALGPEWNETAGRKALQKLDPIDEEQDVETLQVYLDLFNDQLSFSRKQTIIDRILALSDDASDQIHYLGTRAAEFLLIGDTEKAKSDFGRAVEIGRKQPKLPFTARYRLAMSLELLGDISNDPTMLDEASLIYKGLSESDGLSPNGKADLYRMLGEVQRRKHEWAAARDFYKKAFDIEPLGIYQIFNADCCLQLSETREAIKLLDGVQLDELGNEELVDYGFVFANAAIISADWDLLTKAEETLKALKIPQSYFRERRDSLLLQVNEAKSVGATYPSKKEPTSRAGTLARTVNRYFVLKPNFMGIGIDINKILDDVAKGERLHLQEAKKTRT